MKQTLVASLLSIATASNLRTHGDVGGGGGGIVMVDGGSSGSKLFSYSAKDETGSALIQTLKIESNCGDENAFPLKGVSSYAYDAMNPDAPCKSTIQNKPSGLSEAPPTDTSLPVYTKFLLKEIKWIHEERVLPKIEGKTYPRYPCTSMEGDPPLCPSADNALEIPFMATAGMRLLTEEQNDAVWQKVCGVASDAGDYKFAPRGPACGTIPGTMEAYFEWLANVASGLSKTATGTFTIGGASAQIGVPLMNEKMIKHWETLIKQVEDHFGDCKGIFLPTEEGNSDQIPIPIFTKEPGVSCARDFIDIKWTKDIVLGSTLKETAGIGTKFKAVGLVSFLGLRGKGGTVESGVAGGANLVGDSEGGSWSLENDCGPKQAAHSKVEFGRCQKKLRKALHNDFLFKHVKSFFHKYNLKVDDFSYNTPAAIPSMIFNGKIEEQAKYAKVLAKMQDEEEPPEVHLGAAHQLHKDLVDWCTNEEHANFGFNNQNNCMKALWSSLYISSFFDDSFLDEFDPRNVNKREGIHDIRRLQNGEFANLHYKGLDWSEGAYEESVAKSASGVFLELALKKNSRLQFHSHTYLDGVALHLAAATKNNN